MRCLMQIPVYSLSTVQNVQIIMPSELDIAPKDISGRMGRIGLEIITNGIRKRFQKMKEKPNKC